MKRRRMPYVAKIKRDGPLRSADRREMEAMVKRIAAAGEHFAIAGWREDAGFLLVHFATWAKARAMQHWIDRSGIAQRPMPLPYGGPHSAWALDGRSWAVLDLQPAPDGGHRGQGIGLGPAATRRSATSASTFALTVLACIHLRPRSRSHVEMLEPRASSSPSRPSRPTPRRWTSARRPVARLA